MRWKSQPRVQRMPRNVSYYRKSIANCVSKGKKSYSPVIKSAAELRAFLHAFTEADVRTLDTIDLTVLDIQPKELAKLQEWHPGSRYKLKKTGTLESFKRACIEGYVLSDIKFKLSSPTEIDDFLTLCENHAETLFVEQTRLDLSGTLFSSVQFKRLLDIVERNNNLRHLSLNGCGIRDEYFASKDKAHKPTEAFRHLHTLSLCDNAIRHQQVVRRAAHLRRLDLSGNPISQLLYFMHMDNFLRESKASLQHLSLKKIKADRRTPLNILVGTSESMGKTLRVLDLRGSEPSLGAIESLPYSMKALRRLALSGLTHLEGSNYSNGGGSLLDNILSIERLDDLTLQDCRLTSAGLGKIFATNGLRRLDLTNNSSLFTVKVSGSSGNLAAAPGLKWEKNTKMRTLVLNGCTVRDNELQNISTHFPGLRELAITSANISLNQLVASLTGLTELKSLDLREASIAGALSATPTSPRKRKPAETPKPSDRLKPLIEAFNKRDTLKELYISDMVFASRTVLKEFLDALLYVKRINGMSKAKYLAELEKKIEAAALQPSHSRTHVAIKLEAPADSLQGKSESTVATVLVHPDSSFMLAPVQHSASIGSVQSDAGSSEQPSLQGEPVSVSTELRDSLQVEASSEGQHQGGHTAESSRKLFELIRLRGDTKLLHDASLILQPRAETTVVKPHHVSRNSLFSGRSKPPKLNLPPVQESSQEGFSPK